MAPDAQDLVSQPDRCSWAGAHARSPRAYLSGDVLLRGSREALIAVHERDTAAKLLGPEAYRAMYENSPDGVLFTVPDGRVLAANPAACQILKRTEAEICSLGRQGPGRPHR